MSSTEMQLRYINVPALIAESGGDPWAINQSPQVGRPAQIADLAEAFHAAGRCTAESNTAFEQARGRFESAWNHENGENPINDSAEVQRTAQALGTQSVQLPKIGADLENIAAALAKAQKAAAGQIATLERQLHQLDDIIGAAVEQEKDPNLTPKVRNELNAIINACEDDAIDDTKSALAQLESLRDGYADTLQRSLATLHTNGYDPGFLRDVDADTKIPPPGTSAEDVHKWWTSLTPQERQHLLAEHPADLGNLNGVPVDARSDINEAMVNDNLHRVEDIAKQNGASVNDVLNDPGKYGLSAAAVMRYNNAVKTRNGLNTASRAEDPWGRHPPVFLLKYQPEAFGGEGAGAIAIGNPDTAANTAVLVKGLSTGVREGTLSNPDGLRLYQESARADPSGETAVVMWVGYDAPNSVADPGLYEPNMARTGAQLLAPDVNALQVTHLGAPSHVTVVGHSYGSTVVADAAPAYGMHTDDVVLVGSPGTDLAHSAAAFNLPPGGHLYVGAASGDAVTWSPGHVTLRHGGPSLGGLGDDPSVDGFGSTRFEAENPHYTGDPLYDHSHYFDDGPESLFSMADVVSGHGDALQHDGMTAPHRGEYGMPGWVDPEAWRTATTGHRHSGQRAKKGSDECGLRQYGSRSRWRASAWHSAGAVRP